MMQDNAALNFKAWHYPLINDTERAYQTGIIENCLFHNTIVCLPTGMGKTYISLVLMYNFNRWFPAQKCIFMAPTRPLVTQQFRSWQRLFGKLVPSSASSIEITANMPPERRAELWIEKAVIFTTPQIVENDLQAGHLDAHSISCLVIDEAHRAVGNYAYCGVVRLVREASASVRICALTATPGTSIPAIQTLISTLGIERIEFYNDRSPQLADYVSLREQEIKVIDSLGADIEQTCAVIDDLIRRHYLSPLQSLGHHVSGDIDKLSVSSLLQNRSSAPSGNGAMEGYLAGLRIMLHVRDLLIFYGILPMISYIRTLSVGKGNPLKSRVIKQLLASEQLCFLMQRYEALTRDHSFYSHPKLQVLAETLLKHFEGAGETRVMIFSQYRDSVLDICEFLHRFQPRLKPSTLLGHSSSSSAGIGDETKSAKNNRAHQQTTIDRFTAGDSNVLVTTSIGEEGLDIGFVDLIVFFDAQSSPIRLVQRSGRTGRQRNGKIVLLLNAGREVQMYQNSESSSLSLGRALADSIQTFHFNNNLRNPTGNFPSNIQCVKFRLAVDATPSATAKTRTTRIKSAPVKPLTIPQVRPLESSNSIISEPTTVTASIGHSTLTLELMALSARLETPQSRNRKQCQQLFRHTLTQMPIFKLFNYAPTPADDYRFVYDSFHSANAKELELPDSFFEEDIFDQYLEDEMVDVDMSDNNQHQTDNFSSLDFDFSLNSKLASSNNEEAELEAFDWSDPEI